VGLSRYPLGGGGERGEAVARRARALSSKKTKVKTKSRREIYESVFYQSLGAGGGLNLAERERRDLLFTLGRQRLRWEGTFSSLRRARRAEDSRPFLESGNRNEKNRTCSLLMGKRWSSGNRESGRGGRERAVGDKKPLSSTIEVGVLRLRNC